MVIKQTKKITKKSEENFDKKLGATMERFTGVLAEDFKEQVRGLADAIASVQETVNSHTEKIDNLTMDMIEMKSNIIQIRYDVAVQLPNKVDKRLFVELENRVRHLEKK